MNNPSHRLDSSSLRDEATGARGQLKPLMRHNQGANSRNLLNSLALKRERMGTEHHKISNFQKRMLSEFHDRFAKQIILEGNYEREFGKKEGETIKINQNHKRSAVMVVEV